MSKDIYTLAAMSLCFVSESATESRNRCEMLNISNKDRQGLIKAMDFLLAECQESLKNLAKDENGLPIDSNTFNSLMLKTSCLTSSKNYLKSK